MNIKNLWSSFIESELKNTYMKELFGFLDSERACGKEIFPNQSNIFEAFKITDFDEVKVVILGQDPYHGKDQAHGLAFSVQDGVKIPPSLKNILKELQSDLEIDNLRTDSGNLTSWAKQGVFLLNTVLTVESAKAGSHRKKGWEIFTDKVIQNLSDTKKNLVFILWGAPAQKKTVFIDHSKHLVLKSAHPSPLAAYRGFWGSRPFSKVNQYLVSHGKEPIDWGL